MKKHVSASLTITSDTTVQDLIAALETIPSKAKVKLYVDPYHNQFDTGSSEIKFSWDE